MGRNLKLRKKKLTVKKLKKVQRMQTKKMKEDIKKSIKCQKTKNNKNQDKKIKSKKKFNKIRKKIKKISKKKSKQKIIQENFEKKSKTKQNSKKFRKQKSKQNKIVENFEKKNQIKKNLARFLSIPPLVISRIFSCIFLQYFPSFSGMKLSYGQPIFSSISSSSPRLSPSSNFLKIFKSCPNSGQSGIHNTIDIPKIMNFWRIVESDRF